MKFFKILLLLILGLFPFGQLTKLPWGFPEVNVYLHDLVIAGLMMTWLFWHFLKKIPLPRPPLLKPIFLFFVVAITSLLVNLPQLGLRNTMISSLYLWRWIFYTGLYFVVYDILIYNIKWAKRLQWGLVWAGTTTAFFGLLQYFLYPDLRNLIYLGWDPHRYRVFGTFLDPGFLGMILVLGLILLINSHAEVVHEIVVRLQILSRSILVLLNRVIGARKVKRSQNLWAPRVAEIIYYLLFTLCYLVLALTYSRSSYLAYLVGMGVTAWVKKSANLFLVVIVVGILTVLLLPRPVGSEGVKLEREESVWGRVRNWQQTMAIIKDQPLLGVGFNAYRYVQRQYSFLSEEDWQRSHAGAGADASLLFVLATTGIVGFLSYVWLVYHILIYDIRNIMVAASLAALLVHSWFANSLFYPWVMLWFWLLLGFTAKK